MINSFQKLSDLIWSPTRNDEFVAFGNDIFFFKLDPNKSTFNQNTTLKLCDDIQATLIANYTENSNPKLVAWNNDPDRSCLLAVNFSNQKFQLINLNSSTWSEASHNFEVVQEFAFKLNRQCNNLCWNPFQHSLIAAGFERIRNEQSSILVWDINSSVSSNQLMNNESTSESIIYSLDAPVVNDLTRSLFKVNSQFSNLKTKKIIRSYYETGSSETSNSLNWDPFDSNILLAGLNGKSLKIFDTKIKAKALASVNTKLVYNFCKDTSPNGNQDQAVSFYENMIALWDLRMFKEPVNYMNEEDTILKIQWCQRSAGKLAVLANNSNGINIYSIKDKMYGLKLAEEQIPKQLVYDKRNARSKSNVSRGSAGTGDKIFDTSVESLHLNKDSLTNFCWYTFDANKILVSSQSLLNRLKTLYISDAIAIEASPTGNLCWSTSQDRINIIEKFDQEEKSFLYNLKHRTKLDYGLKYDIINIVNGNASIYPSYTRNKPQIPLTNTSSSHVVPLALALNKLSAGINTLIRSDFLYNKQIVLQQLTKQNDQYGVGYMWKWFEIVNNLFEIVIPLNPRNNTIDLPASSRGFFIDLYWYRYSGLKTMLQDFIQKRPENPELWAIHDDRFRVMAYNFCGWDLKENQLNRQLYSYLESTNQIERACCLAVITNNFEKAIEILNTANKDNKFGCLSVALKYINDENMKKSTQMLDSFKRLIEQFENPYLKALFGFLIDRKSEIERIVNDKDILFSDRVALSIYFKFNRSLESKLLEQFDCLIEECVNSGDLHGILLTGLSMNCMNLFQSFIDKTDDVQTISMAIVHTPYQTVIESNQVKFWLNSYRNLLNRLKLWEERAEFDVFKMKLIKFQHSEHPSASNRMTSRSLSNPTQLSLSLMNTHLPNVHFNCDSCGKNVLEKHPEHLISLKHFSSGTLSSAQQQAIQSHNLKSPINSHTHTSTGGNKSNEIVINGCSNCAKFLPLCSVCLQSMKITIQTTQSLTQTLSSSKSQSILSSPKIHSSNKQQQLSSLQSNGATTEPVSNTMTTKGDSEQGFKINNTNLKMFKLKNESNVDLINTKLGNWFSWCQTCKHGGHLKHLIEWFKGHNYCPYVNCDCKCITSDFSH